MAMLAAACPCAIGLATPSAVMAGVDACYARGALLPGGSLAIENLARLTHLVLDKTGTLTEGRLQVSKVSLAEPFRQEKELCCHLLCATERDEAQTHPVGRAVFQWCLRQLQQQRRQLIVDGRGHDAGRNESKAAAINEHEPTLGTAPTRNVDSVPGKGVSCEVQDGSIDNQETWYGVHIGSERFLVEHGIKLPTSPSDDGKGQGNSNRTPIPTTTVHFAIDGTYAGMFLLQDTIRPSAPKVLAALEAMGIALTMLTGDSVGEAARVANELDIEVLAAKSLPNEKKELIEMLKGEIPKGFRHDNEEIQMSSKGRSLANDRPESVSGRNVVAMLGDGLNDTPAQAAADVGILFSLSPLGGRRATTTTTTLALGTSAADVIIMSPDLSVLPKLIDIARKTMRQSRLNLGWAVVYNILAIGLAMGGGVAGHKIDASTAGTMMAFSSVTVLAMSLHLRQRLR
jgi:Cu+-exporting ATPase